MAKSMLGHRSIYPSLLSSPPTLRVKPTRKSDGERCERSVTSVIITVTCFFCENGGAMSGGVASDVIWHYWRPAVPRMLLVSFRAVVLLTFRMLCQRHMQVALWLSVCFWRHGPLLTSCVMLTFGMHLMSSVAADVQIPSAISCLFLCTFR